MKLLCELNDQVILGREGMSHNAPRLTARAIVKNTDGLYAVMYAEKFGLYSLPGGGIEEGEDAPAALRREILEETGCICDEIRELGVITENRACQNYTQKNFYYVVTTMHCPGESCLTESEQASSTAVQWHSFGELCRMISSPEYTTVQQKYLQARDMAALREYSKWVEFYFPRLEELWFYQKMLSDPDTMSYNANWDVSYPGYHRDTGCIDFPEEQWADWYESWKREDSKDFYSYIKRTCDGLWIGDINFHYTPEKDWWDMGIVIYAPYRGQGYAVPALKRMLECAFRDYGVTRIHNDFEVARNEVSAWKAHRSAGFRELGVENGFLEMMITREEYRKGHP